MRPPAVASDPRIRPMEDMHVRTTRTDHSRRRSASALTIGALLLAAVTCGGDDDDATTDGTAATDDTATPVDGSTGSEPTVPAVPQQGGTLRYASVSEPTTLDPHKGTSGGDHVSLYPLFDTLLRANPETLEPEPGLAQSWEYVDELTLQLELEEGVQFHDGTPFDAEAVVFNIDRAMTMEDSSVKPELTAVESAEAISELVVQLHLTQPDSSLLGVLADRVGMMVSPTAAADEETFGRQPVGTGPHTFVSWRPGDAWVYERNDSYWQEGLPYLDGMEIRLLSDANTRINGLRSGQFDFIDTLAPAQLAEVEGIDGITTSSDPTLQQYMIWWNVTRPPLDDVRVRRAINMAIDRQGLWDATMEGTGEPAWLPVPSQHWAFTEELTPSFEYDPEAARALLEEAGYGDGFSLAITSAISGDAVRRAEIVQAQLAEIGVELEVTPQETVESVDNYFERTQVDGYNTSMTSRPDPSITFQTLFSETSYHNTGKWSPEGFEELLADAKAASSTEERAAVFAELSASAVDNALWVPLVYPSSIVAYSTDFAGFTPSLLGKADFLNVHQAS